MRRWARTGWTMRLTSSGMTKPRPPTAANAWAVRNSAIEARGGAVGLVGQRRLGEDGHGVELERGGLLVEDGHAGDVGGEQVGGTLEALEGGADAAGQGAGEHGLGHAGDVLQQDVALAQVG